MNIVVQVLNFISQQILNVPAYLIGIIAAIGLIALKRSAGQVIAGGLKAAMGYLILGAGAGVVVGALAPFGDLVLKSTGAHGYFPHRWIPTRWLSAPICGNLSSKNCNNRMVVASRTVHCGSCS